MVENWSYILIKEATKKYSKTRQTFYNYMRKWLIQTKKVWNKVYMSVQDIERIFGNYLAPTAEELVKNKQSQTSQSIIDATFTHEIRVEALEKQVDDLQKIVTSLPKEETNQSKTELLYSKLQAQLHNIQDYTQILSKKWHLEEKKRIFTWSYVCVVLINCVILSFVW